jgi:putative FmdB family regulatory protein
MPIYEFICSKCKTQFELRLSFSDFDKLAECPKCSSSSQRLISSFACKTGGNIQAAEQPFRRITTKKAESRTSEVLITPPRARQNCCRHQPGKVFVLDTRKSKLAPSRPIDWYAFGQNFAAYNAETQRFNEEIAGKVY